MGSLEKIHGNADQWVDFGNRICEELDSCFESILSERAMNQGQKGDATIAMLLMMERNNHGPRGLGDHLQRVASYAHLLALKCGMSEPEANLVRQIAPMHDIGKWVIPADILKKPGKLTPDEFEIMKTHAQMGYEMLKNSRLEILKLGALVAVEHQEKFDGSGYPKGLKGEEIHIFSRITTVVDVFDALGSKRCYKKAWEVGEIILYFQGQKGCHFDPLLVDLFLSHLEEFLSIRETFAYKD